MTNSIDIESSDSEVKKTTDTVPTSTPWWVLALPLVVVIAILFFSPNFRSTEGVRTAPLGGDFLQEWVGATTFSLDQEHLLYDLEHAQALQHDSQLVGFEWEDKNYFPMVYPPFYYQAFQPFSKISYPLAAKVWAVLSALAFSLAGFLLWRFYPPCRHAFVGCFVIAMIFVPLLNCFIMGQKSTILFLILTGTFLLLHHNRPLLSGFVFGLIIFKPHLGIVIGLAMLLKRQWRFAMGAVSVVVIAFAYSWFTNAQLCLDYIDVVIGMRDYIQTEGYDLADSHSLWGATQLLFSSLSQNAVKLIAAALSLIVVGMLWLTLRGQLKTESARFAFQFAALVFGTVILSPHFFGYDLTILLLPMLLVVSGFEPGQWKSNPFSCSLGIILILMFVCAGFFSQAAHLTSVQPSVLLMVAAISLIGKSLQMKSNQTAS